MRQAATYYDQPQRPPSRLDRLDELFSVLNKHALGNAQVADTYSTIGAREAELPGRVQQLNATGQMAQQRAMSYPEDHAAEMDTLKYSKLGQLGHLTNYLPPQLQSHIVTQLLQQAGLMQPEQQQADPQTAALQAQLQQYLAQKQQAQH